MPYSAGRMLPSKIAYSARNSAGRIYPSLACITGVIEQTEAVVFFFCSFLALRVRVSYTSQTEKASPCSITQQSHRAAEHGLSQGKVGDLRVYETAFSRESFTPAHGASAVRGPNDTAINPYTRQRSFLYRVAIETRTMWTKMHSCVDTFLLDHVVVLAPDLIFLLCGSCVVFVVLSDILINILELLYSASVF